VTEQTEHQFVTRADAHDCSVCGKTIDDPAHKRVYTTVNNFDVMKEMGARNGGIQLAPLSNIVSVRKVKAGTQVTIGVGGDLVASIGFGKFCGGLILCDKEEFEALKAEMEGRA
jgi:hypothetical protein